MYLTISCLVVLFSRGISGQMFGGAIPPKVDPLKKIDTNWFNQTLDHFSNDTPTYWKQRYFVNAEIWNDRKTAYSPVYLRVGGESPIEEGWMNGGSWVYWAYRYGSLLFQLEHRFYGKSHPTPDASVDNLQYLTSDQAIEDIRSFILAMNAQYNLTSRNKWILFGGSYPGSLVAWNRLKQPDLVFGGISSSAPLKAKANFYEYNDVVRASLETYSKGCSTQLNTAIRSTQKMFKTKKGTQTMISKFNICPGFDVNNPKDLNTFYQDIFAGIAKAVQYNEIGLPTQKISFVCGYLNNASAPDPVDRLAQLQKALSNDCIYASYQGNIESYQETNWDSNIVTKNARQWIYQTCNEFGFYQTSEHPNSLFSDTLPLEYYTQQCTDIYGENFNAGQLNDAVAYTNEKYGGTNIDVTNVVFVQGSIDPWHALGMKVNTTDAPLIYIIGTTHTQDMNNRQPSDSVYLTQARNMIQQRLDAWYYKAATETTESTTTDY